ncbi:MAG: DUF1573 domain-containing protein [Deltaproteobacteria bacterium]|nr:DUF1573 domain-containing protein [Deltaproteobacteria bacterium]
MSAFLCLACEASPPAAAPHIVFDAVDFDFGQTQGGAAVRHEFTFYNAGGRDLSISAVRASCNDQASAEPAKSFAPGAGGRIVVDLRTDQVGGTCRHSVTVYANDPAQPVTNLSLNGHVVSAVSANPPQLYVGHLRRGQEAPFPVLLTLAESVRLIDVVTDSHIIGFKIEPSGSESTRRRIRVLIKNDAPTGRFHESLTVRTTSQREAELTVPIVGFVDAGEG